MRTLLSGGRQIRRRAYPTIAPIRSYPTLLLKVETLNEALKLAAMDIAEAGVSGDVPRGGESDDGGNGKKSSSERAKEEEAAAAKRTQLANLALSDAGSNPLATGGKAAGAGGGSGAAGGRSFSSINSGRIFVFQDGTFQAR